MNSIDRVIVIKVGTSTLTKRNEAIELDAEAFGRIGREIAVLQEQGFHIAIVSSAAITAGMIEANIAKRPSNHADMPALQRLASIGWRYILNAWDNSLPNTTIGELLLTKRELESRDEESEAMRVCYELMAHGDIPIINENDAITHEEIAFGDNDTLAALVAVKIKESVLFGDDVSLVVLTDVDGVYRDIKDTGSLVRTIDDIESYSHMIHTGHGELGTGGMTTKFAAARIATASGVDMYITNGQKTHTVQLALNGEVGTRFIA